MRADQLNLRELLDFQPSAGRLLMGNERAIIFRTRAFANLRRLLFDQLGHESARALLLQFGERCGEGDFHAIDEAFEWDTPEEQAMAGTLLHAWEGVVAVVPDTRIVPGMERMTGTWLNSYEAEMHLEEFGRASEPSCYTLQGYARGYALNAFGEQILAVETACRAMGDPECRWEMRPDALWQGDPAAASLLQALTSTTGSIQRQLEQQMELVRDQRAAMMAMAAPVIEVWDGVLALPVIGMVDELRAATMTEALLAAIAIRRVRCAILDLTGVETMDGHTVNFLLHMVRAVGLLGTECVVSGISPAIAQTIARLGIAMPIRAFPTLKNALQHAIRSIEGRVQGG